MPKKKKLALIDAHALIHRAYHALPPMSTRDGQPTNAVFGFTTMLLKMFSTVKPTHVVAAFDMPGPTFRHKAFKEYKAHRGPADDELVSQFDVVRQVCQAFNIPILSQKGFEADDIIGTLVTKLDGDTSKVIITGDMDALQLVDDTTSVLAPKRGLNDTMLYKALEVQEKYGFGPEHVTDYKGLAGDNSDNIPGVEGIGDKTAKDLIAQYGGIEEIFKHLDELPKRAHTRLQGKKKEALFSRKLATIKKDMSLKFKLADAELEDFNADDVHQLFEELEFRSLMTKIPKSKHGSKQQSLFTAGASGQQPETGEAPKLPDNYHLVESAEDKKALRERLAKEELIAFDTETEGLNPREDTIIGMSFAVPRQSAKREGGRLATEAWYVPVTRDEVPEWKNILENTKVGKVGHNVKYDLQVVQQSGVNLTPITADTMLASYLLAPSARQHGLDTLAVQELGHHMIPITQLIGTGKDQKKMSEVPLQQLAHYAAEDADITLQLHEALTPKIADEGLTRVLEELELPLVPVLAHMEQAGVKLDTKALTDVQQKTARRITTLQKKIWSEAGEEFNINSTQQLRVVLYDKLQLPTDDISKTQSGYSTAASELEKLRDKHPIIKLLEEYRELTKLQNTYIKPLPELVGSDGRLHGSFNQTVAATGRLSSADPNLQNIPVRTEAGQQIRAAFIAERGHRLVKADYSQIDLRVAAHITQDQKMLEAFRAEQDFHAATAAWVYDVALDKVQPAQRRNAKTLNFGVLYGMGPLSFARAADVSVEEARSFIERYREQYQGLTAWIQQTIENAEDLGFVETLLGRRRYVPEIHSNAPAIRSAAERAAFNFPIQGTAADILKKAMIELYALLQKKYPAAKLVLSVHDELVCEVAQKDSEKLASDLKKVMEGVFSLDVPLTVDVAMGTNWRDLKPLA